MKKIIFLLAFTLTLAFGSQAQSFQMTGGYVTGDTVTNTGVKACSLKVSKNYNQINIAAEITKLSGTVAGTVTLQGSLDGINYATVDTIVRLLQLPTYTATNATGTQTKVWHLSGNPFLYYKLSYTGSGTMSAVLLGYVLPRSPQ